MRETDQELYAIGRYLTAIAQNEEDFTTLDHGVRLSFPSQFSFFFSKIK